MNMNTVAAVLPVLSGGAWNGSLMGVFYMNTAPEFFFFFLFWFFATIRKHQWKVNLNQPLGEEVEQPFSEVQKKILQMTSHR